MASYRATVPWNETAFGHDQRKRTTVNTALHASPPTESTHSAHPERELSIQLPREEELRNLSLAQRVALRVALHLIVRTRRVAQDRAHAALAEARRLHVLEEYELNRQAQTSVRQVL